jgi:hypothetical protein
MQHFAWESKTSALRVKFIINRLLPKQSLQQINNSIFVFGVGGTGIAQKYNRLQMAVPKVHRRGHLSSRNIHLRSRCTGGRTPQMFHTGSIELGDLENPTKAFGIFILYAIQHEL